jgi:hypothetical protein
MMRRGFLSVIALGTLALAGTSGCTGVAAPTAAETTIDVLDFIVGDGMLWPRIGNHYSNQVVDLARREVCWVKYANPQRFECWRWDDAFVYHAVDHAIDGDTGESYSFSDGRWLPRRLPVSGWSLDLGANRITWFDPPCVASATKSGGFPYRQRAWLEPGVDTGGDLGTRDTIVLEYSPYDPASGRSSTEQFRFARGAGWYRWRRDGIDLQFNRRGGPNVPMNRAVWCGEG